MAGMSNYLASELMDHVLGKGAYSAPTPYLALFTAAPTDSGGGTEVAGGSYARVSLSAYMNTATNGQADNATAIEFAGMPASTVVAVGIYDASSGGNLLIWGLVDTSKDFAAGATARFAIADLITIFD